MRRTSFVPALLLLAGCAANATGGTGASGGSGGQGGTGGGTGGSGGLVLQGGNGGFGGAGSGCSEASQLIYVLSDANELYSFSPLMKQFQLIGTLGCNTAMQPNSMAVDRDAVAWVNYVETDPVFGSDSAGAIFKVSTADASCEPTNIEVPSGYYRMGMGFSTNGENTDAETLYVTAIGLGGTLGKVDFAQGSITTIGSFTGSLAGQSAELTGTGDGRLYGFFTTSPVQVAEIDKSLASILGTKQLPQVDVPSAWAFSFWGGDFYLYTATALDSSSRVNRYRPSDGSTDTSYMTNLGFRIVGAGVSTCAPVVPPN